MTQVHVINQLLESNVEYPNHLELLKKIILITSLGRLQINGQPPDNQIALGDYLFDSERLMLDVTRLSDAKKTQFYQWFLDPYQANKTQNYSSGLSVNEYRGFSAEVSLNWWGQFINWLKRVASDFWVIKEVELSLEYQMTGIEMCHGQSGTLIGFNQYLVPPSGSKYKDPNDPQKEPLGNTKRLFLTDKIVDLLMQSRLGQCDFESILTRPHTHSINVVNMQSRFKDMHDYRKMQKYSDHKPWYARLWSWVVSWFVAPTPIVEAPKQDLLMIFENETTRIYERTVTKELIVVEKKPEIDTVVFCGGGAKILAHVGVWQALEEAGIRPSKFAGSSAGAIISLLCYLGYTAEELLEYTKQFRQDHVVHFDIDSQGFSSTQSLKTALDYVVSKKIMEIVTTNNLPFPQGTMDFVALAALRKQCPESRIGKELVMTATNKKLGKTRYLSLKDSPRFESTKAATVSASLPVLFKPTLIDGEEYNDGGVLSNFPTEAFSDDNSTLLESEFGNNLKLLAIQFNNGTERATIDKVMDKVYKENFILNWIYKRLTGVEDPASGWEQDRMKLRKYAAQSIIVDFEDIPKPSSLQYDDKIAKKVIENGYNATKNYLKLRHSSKEGQAHKNQELMYSTFNSLGDLLAYCCYRGNKPWFDTVKTLILESNLEDKEALIEQSETLEAMYFSVKVSKSTKIKDKTVSFFGAQLSQQDLKPAPQYPTLLLAIYPIFMKITPIFVQDKAEKKLLEQAIHSLSIESPWACLEHFEKIKGNTHILLPILVTSLKALKVSQSEKAFNTLKTIETLLSSDIALLKPGFYGQWTLSAKQSEHILRQLAQGDLTKALSSCAALKQVEGSVEDVYEESSEEEGLLVVRI